MFKRKSKTNSGRSSVRRPHYSASGKVFSYYGNRARREAAEDSENAERSVRRSRLVHIPTIIAVVVIFAGLAYNLVLDTNPRLIVEGQAADRMLLAPEDTYEKSITEVLKGSISNRTKLTINTQKLHENVTNKHPELSAVSVSLPLIGHRPIIYITPSVPFLVLEARSGDEYVVDPSGRVISLDSAKVPDGILKAQDESGLEFNVGEQALASANVAFIQELARQFSAKDIDIRNLELPAASQSLHVRIKGEPYYIKFSFQDDARQQAGAFLAAYNTMTKEKVKPKHYVDVRAGERVYFR